MGVVGTGQWALGWAPDTYDQKFFEAILVISTSHAIPTDAQLCVALALIRLRVHSNMRNIVVDLGLQTDHYRIS